MDRVICAEILAFFGSYRMIQMIWEWIELIEYGTPMPSVNDCGDGLIGGHIRSDRQAAP